MGIDNEKYKAKIKSKLSDKGISISLVSKYETNGVYDPETSQLVDGVDVTISGFGIFTNFSIEELKFKVQQGDKKLIFYCDNLQPEIGMITTLKDGIFSVISAEPISPNDVDLFYRLHLRK